MTVPRLPCFLLSLFCSTTSFAQIDYVQKAQQLNLHTHPTWQHLTYVVKGKSEVDAAHFFLTHQGQHHPEKELKANLQALFSTAAPDASVRCRFPARSEWLINTLKIDVSQLPKVTCPQLEQWWQEIQPHSATLIYATDFMGNPSSMFGHTLLRIDPDRSQELSLVSYAVNYAATVTSGNDLSFAWKGLTGQYPGEYSVLPYYRKVKEYGDFESRDLWEYTLDLRPEEVQFMMRHLWEMQQVSFPYYFISDNCAYRLLGLIDLLRPELKLQHDFRHVTMPIESLKAIEKKGLVKKIQYRPALETQLNHQEQQHGQSLAFVAQRLSVQPQEKFTDFLASYSLLEQAKILEMAYDALYLQLTSRQVLSADAQPKLRHILALRSQIEIEKQRPEPMVPQADPSQSHGAQQLKVTLGQLQGEDVVELAYRQAYHDLIDPQTGFRLGTQLQVLEGSLQYREDELKLNDLILLGINTYAPITAFKSDVSWGFNLAWQQEALDSQGEFSEHDQHGVMNLKTQLGYSTLLGQQHLCYGQLQNQLQLGKALDLGWRTGIGPTIGCQSRWSDQLNSVLSLEVPFWDDVDQWQIKAKGELQYTWQQHQALRIGYEYQTQDSKAWDKLSFSFVQYF